MTGGDLPSPRVAIVTGGANGIGRVYCEHLSQAGALVVVADLDGAGASALAAELDTNAGERVAIGIGTDVTSESAVTDMVRAAIDEFGRVDVLVNNAGTYPHVPFHQISYDDWREVLAVNLDSVFLCSRAVMEPMYDQGAGKIINITTNLVWSGLADMAHYIAAKAGVVGFTRALAREVGPYGITVNAIAPGPVVPDGALSAIGQDRMEQIVAYQCVKRPQRPQDLVGMLLYLAGPASDFVSAQVFTVDGGLTMH